MPGCMKVNAGAPMPCELDDGIPPKKTGCGPAAPKGAPCGGMPKNCWGYCITCMGAPCPGIEGIEGITNMLGPPRRINHTIGMQYKWSCRGPEVIACFDVSRFGCNYCVRQCNTKLRHRYYNEFNEQLEFVCLYRCFGVCVCVYAHFAVEHNYCNRIERLRNKKRITSGCLQVQLYIDIHIVCLGGAARNIGCCSGALGVIGCCSGTRAAALGRFFLALVPGGFA